jgi:hypothetical protein
MPTTQGNRKLLDLKAWEMCSPAPGSTTAGTFIASSRHARQRQLYVASATVHWIYDPFEDGWIQIPSGALAGTFGAGACGTASAVGPTGTATGGSTTALNTALTLARDLRGYSVHITGGPGAGDVRQIASNSVGANGVITPTVPFSAAITAASTYRLLTPRWYVLNAGTLAAGSFKVYCWALNTWLTLAHAGLAATIATDSKLVATPSWSDSGFVTFASGTATGGSSTTLQQTGKSWTAGQWVNSQVRIVAGTGAGQIRAITASTADTLTVPAWTLNPDATSQYVIEGNDDFIYYLGNSAVALIRYSISTNTWTQLAPVAARAGAPSLGMSAHWVYAVPDAAWTNEASIINGRRIYSFRGGAGAVLDYYDIAANTWVSGVTYSPGLEVFGGGSKYTYMGAHLYVQKDATGRWFRYDFAAQQMDPWGTCFYPSGAALAGDTAFDATYYDGATQIHWVYILLNTSNILLRQMVI